MLKKNVGIFPCLRFLPQMLLPVIFLFGLLSSIYAAPQVQLGKTTLTGQDSPAFGLEFFGGEPFKSISIVQHEFSIGSQ